MFNIGDKVEYWYKMGRIGEIVGTEIRGNNTMLEGGTFSNIVDILVKFEDLVDYLTGAWSTLPVCKTQSATIALYVGQLPPKEYKEYSEKLEKWLLTNYNKIVR